MMKVKHRIVTGQFEFVEVDDEHPFDSYETIRNQHDLLHAAFAAKPENTLDDKTFTDLIYKTLHHTMDMNVETWEQCNPAQKTFLKLLTNAINRKKPI